MNTEKIKGLIKNKFVIVAIIFVLLLLLSFAVSGRKQKENTNTGSTNNFTPPVSPTSAAAQSEELKQAIAAQMKADQEYSSWQETTRNAYPWLTEMPLYSEKYFVFFDLNKKVFIGKLYPRVTDNVNSLKTDIVKQLREEFDVPASVLKFEWTIIPK